jgi:hypothetical protein
MREKNYIPLDNYYAIYLAGNELPVAMFNTIELADWFCEHSENCITKEIRTVDFWKASGPLFRDRTTFLKIIKSTQCLIKPLEG